MTAQTLSAGTSQAYRRVIDSLPAELRGEVIAGRLVVMPRPAPAHAHAVRVVAGSFGAWFQDGDGGPGGWWILPEPELTLGVDPEYEPIVPDVCGWRRDRVPVFPEGASVRVVPSWVCEVLSPRTRAHDRDEKLPFYGRAGVDHAWLIDPDAQTLEAFCRDDEVMVPCGVWRDTGRVRVAPFDEVEFDLGRLWLR